MELGAILDLLVGALPAARIVLEVLGSLVVVSSVVVAMTPSDADDAMMNKLKAVPILGSLLLALERFSVIARK